MNGGILDRIDAIIDGRCNCGQPPAPAYEPYCSETCADTPTHHAVHTTSHVDGTPMRWRPDLVTAADDSDLTLIERRPRGRLNAATYWRRGGTLMHLRLDDGNRYVGADVDTSTTGGYDGTPIWDHPTWERLERELKDNRRTVPDPCYDHDGDPWEDLERLSTERLHAMRSASLAPATWHHDVQSPAGAAWERITWKRLCGHCGQRNVPHLGQRYAPDAMTEIYSFDAVTPVRSTPDIEDCDLCPTCRSVWPGPRLRVSRCSDTPGPLRHYRLVLGDHQRSILIRDGDPRAERQLQNAENALWASWLHDNQDQPDVAAWLLGSFDRQIRAGVEHAWRVTSMLSPALAGAMRNIGLAAQNAASSLQGLQLSLPATDEMPPEPEHPLARMNARRRNTAHGPQAPQRPPRQLRPNGR